MMSDRLSDHKIAIIAGTIGSVIAVTDALMLGRNATSAEDVTIGEDAALFIRQAIADVRGNRPNGAPITWADARMILAASLRRCLEKLEAS